MVVVVTLADGSVVFMIVAIVLVTMGAVELDCVVVVVDVMLLVVGAFVVIVATLLSAYSEASSETCSMVVSLVHDQNRKGSNQQPLHLMCSRYSFVSSTSSQH